MWRFLIGRVLQTLLSMLVVISIVFVLTRLSGDPVNLLLDVNATERDQEVLTRGIKGGQVIGKTSADGTKVEEREVSVPDFLATVVQALGIDPTTQNMSNVGRPIRITDPGAKVIAEVLG